MRKISVILTTLVLAAMLLVACGAEETNTAGPNTTSSPEVPPVTADTTATDDGTSLTETVVPSTDTTTTPEIPVTGENDPARLSNQLDFTVWNQNGEQIGEVDDMVLDLDNIRIAYVVVGTGGFLDLGERDILVPWDSLELQTGTGDTTGGEQNVFILQADQELFNNVPEFDLNGLPEVGQPAGDWDAEIRNYWESGVVPATPDPNMTATTDPGTGQATATADTGTDQATATPGAGTDQGQAEALQGVVLASDVLGTPIGLSPGQGQGTGQGQGQVQATDTPVNGAGQATATTDPNQGSGQGVGNFSGTIDDIIVDIDTGDLLYAVVNTTLDDGERWIAIPIGFFQWDATNSMILLNTNPAQLRDAPFFSEGEFPDTSAEGWNTDVDTYWGTP